MSYLFSVHGAGNLLVTGELVETVAFKLLQLAVTELPQDVKDALHKAYRQETNQVGKAQLKAILDNIELAEKTCSPMCQDTGIIIFYVKAGSQIQGLDQIESALRNAVEKATCEVPLRPNAVDPFTQQNSGNNLGRHVPYIHWEIVPGNSLEITVLPKGGGSENVSALAMLTPGQGVSGLKRFVLDTIIAAGAKPCPPTVIGVGVGGGADIAMNLAKANLLKPLGEPNPDPELAKLEQELLQAANSSGIGPMGLGGKTTVLDIKVDYAHRHPASYPVAVVVQCWAARRASAKIYSDGKVEYLTHKVV
ncbi:MAG: fumarate hydratase [Candidatus Bathyarchaeota archaeon]|nr:fumarate hydratase [Candidatus Bathyarchaeota archaeon]